jgi:hypothetical protein
MTEVIDFSTVATVHDLPPVKVIHGLTIIDLGNDYANPPLPSANPRIIDVDNDGQNELFISQGTLRLIPNPQWGAVRIGIVATPFAGGPKSITVKAYDCNGTEVDKTYNVNTQQKGPDKMIVMATEICYLEIRGEETSIDKIAFISA